MSRESFHGSVPRGAADAPAPGAFGCGKICGPHSREPTNRSRHWLRKTMPKGQALLRGAPFMEQQQGAQPSARSRSPALSVSYGSIGGWPEVVSVSESVRTDGGVG